MVKSLKYLSSSSKVSLNIMQTLEHLSEFIIDTITQSDYPGFEAKAFRLGLPIQYHNAPASLFLKALKSDNIYIQLAALRWFQEKPNQTFSHQDAILNFLKSNDIWLRFEAIKTIERMSSPKENLAVALSPLMLDESAMVKQEAIKAFGKIIRKLKINKPELLTNLEIASQDKNHEVKRKALKALRLIKALQ